MTFGEKIPTLTQWKIYVSLPILKASSFDAVRI